MAEDKPKAVRGPGGKFVGNNTPPSTPAPEEEATSAYSPGCAPGSFVWAADHIVNGRTVRRECWIGAKSICASHPSRNMLENEDFLANDWVLV